MHTSKKAAVCVIIESLIFAGLCTLALPLKMALFHLNGHDQYIVFML